MIWCLPLILPCMSPFASDTWTAEQFAGSNSTQCSRTELSGPFCSKLAVFFCGATSTESKESCVFLRSSARASVTSRARPAPCALPDLPPVQPCGSMRPAAWSGDSAVACNELLPRQLLISENYLSSRWIQAKIVANSRSARVHSRSYIEVLKNWNVWGAVYFNVFYQIYQNLLYVFTHLAALLWKDFSCAWAIEPAGPLSLTEEWQQLYATASGTGDPTNRTSVTALTANNWQSDLAKWWKLAAIPLLHCDLFFLWTGSLAFSSGPKCALWSSIRTSPQLLLVLHAPWPSVQVLQAANAVLRSESESNRRTLRALKFCAEMVAELLSLCSVSSNFLFAEHFYGHFVEAWDVEEDGLWSLQLTTLFGNLKEYRCYWDSCCRDVSSLLWQPVYDTLLGLYFMNNWKYYHKMLLRDSNIGISFWNVQCPVNIPQSDIRVERCRLLSWLEQDPPHCHVDCAGQCSSGSVRIFKWPVTSMPGLLTSCVNLSKRPDRERFCMYQGFWME